MKEKMKWVSVVICALFISVALAMPVLAQEKKKEEKKEKTYKVWGKLVAAPADPSGKLAAVALETEKKEMVSIVNNAVAKKMEKLIGSAAEVSGQPKEIDGKKAVEVWTFVRKDSPNAPTKKPKADAG